MAASLALASSGRVVLRHVYRAQDQKTVDCCTSMAITTCMEVFNQRTGPGIRLSPLFHCYCAQPEPGPPVATEIGRGLEVAARVGICRRPLYDPAMTDEAAQTLPSDGAFADARRRRLLTAAGQPAYQRLSDFDRIAGWRASLDAYGPIVCGFWITPGYWRLKNTGGPGLTVHPPFAMEPGQKGHAVAILGYDDSVGAFLVKDSRGTSFGDFGYWWLPYSFADSDLVAQGWALQQVSVPTP